MDEATLNILIRAAIREPQPRRVSDAILTASKQKAVNLIGQRLLGAEPDYFRKRVSLSSYTNRFSLPSDLDHLLAVWDMETNALSVSGAADNGSGAIRITTSAAHGLATGDIVTIHDVAGTTEANSTWAVTYVDSTNFDLQNSTFANGYTSGGKVFEEKNYDRIVRTESSENLATDDTKWYLDGSVIVVDDPDFTYDVIINYRYTPSTTVETALTQIPEKFHFGIESFCVLDLAPIAADTPDDYKKLQPTLEIHTGLLSQAMMMIDNFKISQESKALSDVSRIKRRI